MTHKHSAADVLILPNELINVSILHPLGNHRQPVFTHCCSDEWQDVWMPEVLPGNCFSAESLQCIQLDECSGGNKTLTLRITSMSLVMYIRKTLTATRRPLYVLRDTLAEFPDSTSTESFEQSGMCIDLGIMRYRLHVLQSSLNSFCRS